MRGRSKHGRVPDATKELQPRKPTSLAYRVSSAWPGLQFLEGLLIRSARDGRPDAQALALFFTRLARADRPPRQGWLVRLDSEGDSKSAYTLPIRAGYAASVASRRRSQTG